MRDFAATGKRGIKKGPSPQARPRSQILGEDRHNWRRPLCTAANILQRKKAALRKLSRLNPFFTGLADGCPVENIRARFDSTDGASDCSPASGTSGPVIDPLSQLRDIGVTLDALAALRPVRTGSQTEFEAGIVRMADILDQGLDFLRQCGDAGAVASLSPAADMLGTELRVGIADLVGRHAL